MVPNGSSNARRSLDFDQAVTPPRGSPMHKVGSPTGSTMATSQLSSSGVTHHNHNDIEYHEERHLWGARYEGEYRRGKKHGHGLFHWPNGSVYEGEFFNDKVHGHGTNRMQNGRTYQGQWQANKMHGDGVFTFGDGRRYEGQYVNGEKHGTGVFFWAD